MKNQHRLPGHVTPERYRLMLKPDLEGFVFQGEETIYLKLKKSGKQITLHAKELDILSAQFVSGRRQFTAKNIKYKPEDETVALEFGSLLPKGKGELFIQFKGILNDKMSGFYRSRYLHEGKEKHLATTQFEATDARRAFPCFDEPASKAVFDVTLVVPKQMTAISNTVAVKIAEHDAGYKVVEFAPTPKMSTYLLAFVVGNLEYIEARSKRGVLVRVFTTPEKKHQAKFALSCATRALDFYEKYFDIAYPLPVLDMIAIPDFASAAMENWGAIIYRESALLVDEAGSSAATRQWVAIVVAHEIAHMWFGNLVTMHWWTHLWLNEGFASYMEYKCVDSLFPEWRMWEQYVSGRMSAALRLDALENTHPVEVEVRHPGEISEIFDEVSYAKGSAVIRMLAEYLGEKVFREGLRHYLKKHAYKNTRTEDLWQALQAVSKKPVQRIMANWTKQPGYPLLRLTEQPQNLRLDQARFYSSRLSRQAAKNSQLWHIPVAYGSSKILLTSRRQNVPKARVPLKFNLGETSLFRVSYPASYLQSLGRLVSAKKLSAIDRLGLIRDAFALSESGQLPAAKVLELALAYKNEDELIVWEELADGLTRLRSLLYGTTAYESYLAFCRDLFSGIGKKLGWSAGKNETHHRHMLRSLVLVQLGASGSQKVLSQAKSRLYSSRPLPANLKGAVYGLAARTGGKKVHATLLAKYKAASSHEEQDRLGRSLAQFSDARLLKLTLDFSLSGQVRAQDAPFIIAAVLQNPAGRDLAWKFISQNWQELVKRYGDGLGLLGRLLKATGVFTSRKKAQALEKFFKRHAVSGAERTVRQVLEKVRSNADWLEREEKNIYHWLQNRV